MFDKRLNCLNFLHTLRAIIIPQPEHSPASPQFDTKFRDQIIRSSRLKGIHPHQNFHPFHINPISFLPLNFYRFSVWWWGNHKAATNASTPIAPPMPATNPFAAPELVLAGGVVPVPVPVPAAGVLVNLVVPAVTVVVDIPEVDRTVVAVVVLENLVDELRVELRPVAVAEKDLQRFVPTV